MRNEIISISEKPAKTQDDIQYVSDILKNVKKVSLNTKIKELKISDSDLNNWLFKNSYRIIKTCGASSLYNLVKKMKKFPDQDIACALSKENKLFFFITDFNPNATDPRLRVIFADENIYKNPCDFWQDIKTTGAISNEGSVQLLNGKKPEKILHRILKMTTKPNDIVLDFFSGSGTTGAVAHKMGRRYIMCEQLDSHISKQIERLNNVINGDTTGISNLVNWNGGGSFVYCELAKLNQNFVDAIEKATTDEELTNLYSAILETGFISYKITPKNIDVNADDFTSLSINDKKKLLMDLIDKNQLYINLCDMDDEICGVSESDKAFTKSFYGEI